MSEFNRYCQERSVEYFNLSEIGGVCEISSKEREGPSSFRLKAPHIYTRYKSYHNKSVRQCPPRRAVLLNSKYFYFFLLRPIRCSRFRLSVSLLPFDARSLVARTLSPPQQQRQQPLQLQPHQCLTVVVMVCLLCYLFCVIHALLLLCYSCYS